MLGKYLPESSHYGLQIILSQGGTLIGFCELTGKKKIVKVTLKCYILVSVTCLTLGSIYPIPSFPKPPTHDRHNQAISTNVSNRDHKDTHIPIRSDHIYRNIKKVLDIQP